MLLFDRMMVLDFGRNCKFHHQFRADGQHTYSNIFERVRGYRDGGKLRLYTPGSERRAFAFPGLRIRRQPGGLTPELASGFPECRDVSLPPSRPL